MDFSVLREQRSVWWQGFLRWVSFKPGMKKVREWWIEYEMDMR